jgi:arylsulfatase A-like enzyme
MIGDHDLVVKGAYFYDGCSKVPFLMRWPDKITGGRRVEALVQPHDICATVLTAAGVLDPGVQAEMPTSVDLLPLVRGEKARVHDYVVCAYRNSGISDDKRPWDPPIYATMIRDGRYKLTVYHGTGGGAEAELYDMTEDPNELNDLYSSPEAGAVRQELTDKLVEWMFQQELRERGSRGGEQLPGPNDVLDNRLKS